MPPANPAPRHLLSINDLSPDDVRRLFDLADGDMDREALRDQTVITAFFEDSTRTRVSFVRAAQSLGAHTIDFSAKSSSVSKGESLVDTVQTIDQMEPQVLVVRHGSAGAAKLIAGNVRCSVINAGDGAHEHPTQALLDAYTMQQHLGDIVGLNVVIVGDIAHSRVARSNVLLLKKLGASVTLVGPATLLPGGLARLGATLSHDLDAALERADVLYLLRVQFERIGSARFPSVGEYTSLYGLTRDRLARLRERCLIMHPGPMNRGVEIDSAAADDARSVVLQQVRNGVTIRRAILLMLTDIPKGGNP